MSKKPKKEPVHKLYEDTRVQAERLADPKAKVASVRRVEPVQTPKAALEVLTDIIRDSRKGKDTSNARDDYIFEMARKRVSYTEIARQLNMPVGEVQRIHNERLKIEYSQSPEEMRMVLVDQISALQERLWAMADMGVDKDTARLILQTVKVLADLYSLTKQEASVTINLVNKHQSVLIVASVNAALDHLLSVPEVAAALPLTQRTQLVSEALNLAADRVQEAQDEMIVVG